MREYIDLTKALATRQGYQVALLEGEALPTEMVFPGNPVRVRFAQPTGDLIDWIHAEGIGHHWMIGYGHVGEDIRAEGDATRIAVTLSDDDTGRASAVVLP